MFEDEARNGNKVFSVGKELDTGYQIHDNFTQSLIKSKSLEVFPIISLPASRAGRGKGAKKIKVCVSYGYKSLFGHFDLIFHVYKISFFLISLLFCMKKHQTH